MDPAEFGYSTTPLHHAPYGPIHPSALKGANKDKVAVITGAAQGIGAAIAISLSASGSNVAILDLDLSALQQTKQACEAQNVKAEAYVCDVTNEQTVKETFNSIEADLGPIDILINNAGIFDQRPFMMGTVESVWRQMEVNFKGPLITMHNVLGRMRDRGGKGCIINIASRSATVDVPMTLGYVTSKAALTRATSTLQREMGLDGLDGGIQFYALHPGGVKGAMGGAGAPQDVVNKYGDIRDEKFFMNLFKDGPELCGQTCAWLATGQGKELRGLYLDCRQDVTKLLEKGREALLKEKKNVLTVDFLDGYCNEP